MRLVLLLMMTVSASVFAQVPREQIQKEMHRVRGGIENCYQDSWDGKAPVDGTVTISFTIPGPGFVKDVSVSADTFQNEKMSECMVKVVKYLRFHTAGTEPVKVKYPFKFVGGAGKGK